MGLRDVPGKGSKMSQNGCQNQNMAKKKKKRKESKSLLGGGMSGHIRYGLGLEIFQIPGGWQTGSETERRTDGRADNNDWWHKAPAANAINTHRRHITGMRSRSRSPSPEYYVL